MVYTKLLKSKNVKNLRRYKTIYFSKELVSIFFMIVHGCVKPDPLTFQRPAVHRAPTLGVHVDKLIYSSSHIVQITDF